MGGVFDSEGDDLANRRYPFALFLGMLLIVLTPLNMEAQAGLPEREQKQNPQPATTIGVSASGQAEWAIFSNNPSDGLPLYTFGGTGRIGVGIDRESHPILLGAELLYTLAPVVSGDKLSVVGIGATASWPIQMATRLDLDIALSAGYYHSFFENVNSGLAYGSASAGMRFLLSPAFDLKLRGVLRSYLGLRNSVGIDIGTVFHTGSLQERRNRLAATSGSGLRRPGPGEGFDIQRLIIEQLFPVLRTYYNEHPIGFIAIKNRGSDPISNLSISVLIPDYMELPRTNQFSEPIGPGDTISVDLFALLDEAVLGITEGDQAPCRISLIFIQGDEQYEQIIDETIRFYDRNALTWDDDQKAAAFVTAKDPAVLSIAKEMAGLVNEIGSPEINDHLQIAIAMHEALDVHGIRYVVDPSTPYAQLSETPTAVDYVQFPRQTLEYRAGDCDDISILYAALLESVSVPTALVTHPGHIYLAFDTGLTSDQLDSTLIPSEQAIEQKGTMWIPVEITLRNRGFLEAWATGARQWRQYKEQGLAAFIPVSEAWRTFAPIQLPGTSSIRSVDQDQTTAAFKRQLESLISRAIQPMVDNLVKRIESDPDNPRLKNHLAVLYGRYGRVSEARTLLQEIVRTRDYVPALINLANIELRGSEFDQARGYYQRALNQDGKSVAALVGLAQLEHAAGNQSEAQELYNRLTELDSSVAERYSHIASGSTSGMSRAASGSSLSLEWEVEE
jgi:hypothetical protein